MAAVLIYRIGSQNYSQSYSLVIFDDKLYEMSKVKFEHDGRNVLWEKANVPLEQADAARKTKDDIVARLNQGQEITPEQIEQELAPFFKPSPSHIKPY